MELGSTVAADEDADFERGSRFVVGGAHDAHGRLAGGLAQQAGLVLVEVDRLVDGVDARREDAGLPGDVGIERALHIPARELGAELHGDVDIVELHGLVVGKAEATDFPHGRSFGHFESRCDAADVLADENSSDAQVQAAYGQLKLAIEGLKDAE